MEETMKNKNQLIGCCGLDCETCDAQLFCLCHRHAPFADIAGGTIPCEHLWRTVSGVLPSCVPVPGAKINISLGGYAMSKRMRQYIGILAALRGRYEKE